MNEQYDYKNKDRRKMTRFSLDPKISMGNLITICLIVIAYIMAWAKMDSRVTAVENLSITTTTSVQQMATTVGRLSVLSDVYVPKIELLLRDKEFSDKWGKIDHPDRVKP